MFRSLMSAAIVAATLTGCASAPTSLILAPDAPLITSSAQQGSLQLTSVDRRSEQYVVKVRNGDGAAELLSPSQAPRQLLDQGVRQGFSQLGYQLDPASNTQMTLVLDKAVLEIDQGTFSHDAKGLFEATVKINTKVQTLTKTFTVTSAFSGPMKPDLARIEREVNDRLSQLMTNIVNDEELQQFIR